MRDTSTSHGKRATEIAHGPGVIQLLDPVHDQPQPQPRRPYREQLRLFVLVDGQHLRAKSVAPTSPDEARERTSAIQKLKFPGSSTGSGPYVWFSRCTTHGAVPFRSLSRNTWHTATSSSHVAAAPRRRLGGSSSSPAAAPAAAVLACSASSTSSGKSLILRMTVIGHSHATPGHAQLDASDHVPVEAPALDDPEPLRAPRLHHAAPVREHLHRPDFQQRAKVRAAPCRARRHDHPETRVRRLEAPPQHQPVPVRASASPRAPRGGTHRGSKKCSIVGEPGNDSWHTKIGVSSRESRSSASIAALRSAYMSGNPFRTVAGGV